MPLNYHVVGLKAGSDLREICESSTYVYRDRFLFIGVPDSEVNIDSRRIARMPAAVKTEVFF
jgi:hypothetical protein